MSDKSHKIQTYDDLMGKGGPLKSGHVTASAPPYTPALDFDGIGPSQSSGPAGGSGQDGSPHGAAGSYVMASGTGRLYKPTVYLCPTHGEVTHTIGFNVEGGGSTYCIACLFDLPRALGLNPVQRAPEPKNTESGT